MTRAVAEVDLHYGAPVDRYEFSVNGIARELMSLLWKRIMGDAPPRARHSRKANEVIKAPITKPIISGLRY